MQEKKILPRRKGVVLLSVLGCLFVFFAKTEKNLASAGNILWTADYIGSTLLWTVVLGCLLGFLGTWVVHRLWNRAQTAEDTGKKTFSMIRKRGNFYRKSMHWQNLGDLRFCRRST